MKTNIRDVSCSLLPWSSNLNRLVGRASSRAGQGRARPGSRLRSPHGAPSAATAGLTLIEIMVAVTLLVVIMTGLFAAFLATQRALRYSSSQTDVLEGGRSTMSLITRELPEMTASRQEEAINAWSDTPRGGITMPRADTTQQTNLLQDFFFVTRHHDPVSGHDVWNGVGYFITIRTAGFGSPSAGLGSLYRYVNHLTNTVGVDLRWLYADFTNNATTDNPNAGHVADGIVHLTVRAFNARGEPYLFYDKGGPSLYGSTNDINVWSTAAEAPTGWGFAFTNKAVPAYVDVELGLVDPKIYRQYFAMNPLAQNNFLMNQVGKVHLFRQRVPILNHYEP